MACMIELGELERRYGDFEKRNVRVYAISNDDAPAAGLNQKDLPHLTVVSDAKMDMARALGTVHPKAAPDGGDTNAPTTILVDGSGTVRWLGQPGHLFERIPTDDVLAAIDANLKTDY